MKVLLFHLKNFFVVVNNIFSSAVVGGLRYMLHINNSSSSSFYNYKVYQRQPKPNDFQIIQHYEFYEGS